MKGMRIFLSYGHDNYSLLALRLTSDLELKTQPCSGFRRNREAKLELCRRPSLRGPARRLWK